MAGTAGETAQPDRNYTVRTVRQQQRVGDIGMVLHGEADPASPWAGAAREGAALAILAPDTGYDGARGGVESQPATHAGPLLLAGDETRTFAFRSGAWTRTPDPARLGVRRIM